MGNKKIDVFVFLAIMIFMFIISVVFLVTPDFDFLNYQAYNCYSLLNNRFPIDFYACNTRTCISPFLYLPEYILMFKLNNHPYWFVFIAMLDSVFLLFLVYKLTVLTFKDKINSDLLIITSAFCVVYCACSPVMMNVLDFSRGDCKIAVLVLWGFYILLKNIFFPDSMQRTKKIVIAGSLIGLAVALKLTAVVYLASIAIIILSFGFAGKIEKPFKSVFLFILPSVLFFFLINGYWYYLCYKYYHNPVFPYYNDIFKSEYAPFESFIVSDYEQLAPQNWIEFVFYPFFKANEQNYTHFWGIEDYFFDSRYAINYVSVLIIFIYSIWAFLRKTANKLFENTNKNIYICIVLFTVLVYIINLILFGTYRYIVASSVLYGIVLALIIIALFSMIKVRTISSIFIIASYIIVSFVVYKYSNNGIYPPFNYVNYPRKEWNFKNITKVIEYKDFNFDDDSTVILFHFPSSYAVINQNQKVKNVGFSYDFVHNFLTDFENEKNSYLAKKLANILDSRQKVYIIYSKLGPDDIDDVISDLAKKYNRTMRNCENTDIKFFNTDLNYGTTKCDLIKIEEK